MNVQTNSEQVSTQVQTSTVHLPENYPVEFKEDFFVIVCKTDDLMPSVWCDQLMLMRRDVKARIGDIVMTSADHLRIEFCTVAGIYSAVCVAAKAQLLEIPPDGTVSKAA